MNCKHIILHNYKNIGDNMESSGTGENIKASDPSSRASGRINALKLFAWAIAKHLGLFLLGIFVGMGIVLKNPINTKKDVSDSLDNTKQVVLEVKTSYSLN
jgi:hypothetical protein